MLACRQAAILDHAVDVHPHQVVQNVDSLGQIVPRQNERDDSGSAVGSHRDRILQPHYIEFAPQIAFLDDRGQIGRRLQQFCVRFDPLGIPGPGPGHLGKPLVFELAFNLEALGLEPQSRECRDPGADRRANQQQPPPLAERRFDERLALFRGKRTRFRERPLHDVR